LFVVSVFIRVPLLLLLVLRSLLHVVILNLTAILYSEQLKAMR